MQKFIDALKSALSRIVNLFSSGKAQAALEAVVSLVPKALPVVRFITSITPTRADEEIIALLDRFGLQERAAAYLALPPADRGAALRAVAVSLLAKQAPDQPERILGAAIELAVVADRADAK